MGRSIVYTTARHMIVSKNSIRHGECIWRNFKRTLHEKTTGFDQTGDWVKDVIRIGTKGSNKA